MRSIGQMTSDNSCNLLWVSTMAPDKPRSQMLGVLFFVAFFTGMMFIPLLVLVGCLTRVSLIPISLFYLLWLVYDWNSIDKGWNCSSDFQDWVCGWNIWLSFRSYFSGKLIKTAELDPTENYIMGYHPHG